MFSFGASKPFTSNNTTTTFGSNTSGSGTQIGSNNMPTIGITPPTTPGNLFGNKFNTTSTINPTNSFFSSTPNTFQQQPPSNIVPYPKSTMFLDLPKDMQTSLESIEKIMHKEIEVAMSLDSIPFSSTATPNIKNGKNEIEEMINKIERKISLAEAGQLGCEDVIMKSKHTIYTYWRYGESVSHREQNKNGSNVTTILPNPSSSFLPLLLSSLERDVSELEIVSNILRRQIDSQNEDLKISSITETCKNQYLLLQSLSSRVRKFIDSS